MHRFAFSPAVAATMSLCAAVGVVAPAHAAESVDHAAMIRSLDAAAADRGKQVYASICFACHGVDGKQPTNPQALPFATGQLKNGADPYAMFRTLTDGFNTMPSHSFLSPRQRYDAIAYVREAFLKEDNPAQYFRVTDEYLAKLPKPDPNAAPDDEQNAERDYGPVLASQLGGEVNSGLTFRLPHGVAFNYDLHRMRSGGAWTGGFLDLAETHHYKQRGEGMPKPDGTRIDGLQTYAWQLGDSFDIAPDAKPTRGPVRSDWARYHGHYLHGDAAILSYAIHGRQVLETVGVDRSPSLLVLHHTFRVEPGDNALRLAVARFEGKAKAEAGWGMLNTGGVAYDGPAGVNGVPAEHALVRVGVPIPREADGGFPFAAAAVVGDTEGLLWTVDAERRIVLTVPASSKPRVFRLLRTGGGEIPDHDRFVNYLQHAASRTTVADPRDLTHGRDDRRWPQQLTVAGSLGEPVNGYALDTIPVPFENPWNAWVRTSAIDFFPDGRAVVTTHGGDVWIVSGIDGSLGKVTWSRFAAGLFEPFGVKVVDGVIYVTARDGIKRLHDADGNGEADYVEAFYTDPDVSSTFHAYNFDLHTDSGGNFYFAKAGQFTHYSIPGTILRVPPTGGRADIVGFGLRTPNGMGALPGDRFTVSDNQGAWVPAGRISLIRPDRCDFFGSMPINKEQTAWLKDRFGGKLPESHDEPIVWMPQELDNSSGGQLWVDDPRWGPLSGRLLHSSFGKGWLYYMSLQDVGDKTQASIVALGHQWDAGVMRLRVNPHDGQVYGVGLSGWQGPRGGKDGCLQRLRYAGDPAKPARIIEATRVSPSGIELTFNFPLDPDVAAKPESWNAEMWDYKWSSKYGSDQFSVRHPGDKGHDGLRVAKVTLANDARTVHLELPDMAVCDQLLLKMKLKDATGRAFEEQVYYTIHAIPSQ